MPIYGQFLVVGLWLGVLVAGCDRVQELIPDQQSSEETSSPAVPEPAVTPPPAMVEIPTPAPRTPEEIIAEFLALPSQEKTDARLLEVTGLSEGLDKVASLDLSMSRVTDEGCLQLDRLTSLESLNLARTLISRLTIERLPKLTKLQDLDLSDTPRVDGACMVSVGQLSHLETLNLQRTLVDDASLEQLGNLPQLRVLKLDGVRNLTGRPFAEQVKHGKFRHLQELSFSGSQFGLYALSVPAGLSELEVLRASGAGLSDDAVLRLQFCKNLRVVELSNNSLTPVAVQQLPKLKKLEVLRLDGVPGILDVALNSLKQLKQLKELGLEGTGVTPEAAKKLKADFLPETTIYYGGDKL